MTPQRVQLSRRKGWRLPPNTISVARPTKWGNPYQVKPAPAAYALDHPAWIVVEHWEGQRITRGGWHRSKQTATEAAVRLFAATAAAGSIRDQLAGRNLACWCPLPEPGQPDWCHAAVLLRLANEREP